MSCADGERKARTEADSERDDRKKGKDENRSRFEAAANFGAIPSPDLERITSDRPTRRYEQGWKIDQAGTYVKRTVSSPMGSCFRRRSGGTGPAKKGLPPPRT